MSMSSQYQGDLRILLYHRGVSNQPDVELGMPAYLDRFLDRETRLANP
jgi:hypothetical protein